MKHSSEKFFSKNIKPRNHFFRRFFITYLLVLLVPIMGFPVIFQYSSHRIQEQETAMRSLLVEESASAMDEALDQIGKTLLNLEQNTDLYKLLYWKHAPIQGSTDAYELYRAQKQMTKLLEYDRFNYDYAIFLPQADLVYSANSFVYGIEWFYKHVASYGGMDYETFSQTILKSEHNLDVIPSLQLVNRKNTSKERFYRQEEGILYLISLPFSIGSSRSSQGVAAIHLNSDLLNKLNEVPVSAHGCTFVEDGDHNLIYGFFGDEYSGDVPELTFPEETSGHFTTKLNGTRCLISYTTSSYNGWRYISVSPINELNSSLIFFRNIFYFILLAVSVVGLSFCFYFTKQNSVPLENMLVSLQKQSGSTPLPSLNSFSALQKHVQNTLEDNHKLGQLLAEQRKTQTSSFYDRLRNGQFSSVEELASYADYLGIPIDAASYGFLLISFDAAESTQNEFTAQNLAQIYTEHLHFSNLPFRMQTHPISMNQLGIFLFFPDAEAEKNKELLKQGFESAFYDALHQFSTEIRISCGDFYADPMDISLSYSEAITAMKEISMAPPSYMICFYSDIAGEPEVYYYPSTVKTKLTGLVKSRNLEGIQELLTALFTENLEKRSLTPQMQEAFFFDLRIAVIRVAQEVKVPVPAELFHRHKTLNPEREFEQISSYYKQMILDLAPETESDDTPRKIMAYINEHYGDSSLSVTSAAEVFSMSSSYFSTYFKKHLDVTFSKYLEGLRIEKACELIRNSDLNIEAIATEVGYTSSLSFRRAFKKVMGMPPSSYR